MTEEEALARAVALDVREAVVSIRERAVANVISDLTTLKETIEESLATLLGVTR